MSTRLLSVMAAYAVLSGCDTKYVTQPDLQLLTIEQANDARQAAAKWIGDGGQALFICGQPDGLSLNTMEWDKGFQPDGMTDGRHVFILTPDGKPDIIVRDAWGPPYYSTLDECQVERLSQGKLEIWVVRCPSNGITETHNITTANGKLVDLWTANKPRSAAGPRAILYKSHCARG